MESSWTRFVTEEDVAVEEDLLKNPFNLKGWMRYIDRKRDSPMETVHFIYERAIKELPGSYKLWKLYLDLRRVQLQKQSRSEMNEEIRVQMQQDVNHCYERALVFMHKMPRIWLDYCEFLKEQGAITKTRRTFDRALRSLPITQHKRIWEKYLTFANECGVVETAVRIYRRYIKVDPSATEDFVDLLLHHQRYDEAAQQMLSLANNEKFASARGKTIYELWLELAELLCAHPKDIQSVRIEPIIRSGLERFSDQVGRLWSALARYWILQGNFEKARDVYEEAISTVMTVRDFSQVFEAYAEFEESVLSARIQRVGETDGDVEIDLRLARLEKLLERRPFLINDVLLRQDSNNVSEWMKRIELWGDNQQKVIATYKKALDTVKPRKAHGRLQDLWINYAKLYEKIALQENSSEPDLTQARDTFEKATETPFKHPDSLAEVYIAYADMELQHDHISKARDVLARGLMPPIGMKRPIHTIQYLEESLPVQQRLFKSIKLWNHFVDLEEAFGTMETTKAAYERILELKICTPQTIINYALFLEEHKYFEESFKVFERGIDIFGQPIAFDLWNVYLSKFMNRFDKGKLERARELFEQALDGCPEKYAKKLYLLYGKLESEHGLTKKAMQIYDRATQAVSKTDRFEMYNFYVATAVENYGLISARPIYEKALESLPDKDSKVMGMRFADLEVKLGEIERARAVFSYCSQLADPKMDPGYWQAWHDFEVKHGNEDTFKDMLRIKRSVQAQYANNINVMAGTILANRLGADKTNESLSSTFVAAGTTHDGKTVEVEKKDENAGASDPNEIHMDDVDDDEGQEMDMTQ